MPKKSWARSIRILVIVFPILTGVSATIYGLYLYNSTQIFYHEDRPVPPGFLVFSSMELTSANLSIQIIEVNFAQGRSDKAAMICDFDLASTLKDDQTIGLQIPYVLEEIIDSKFDVQVSKREIVRETSPRTDGGQQTEITIVYFTFKPNQAVTHYSFNIFFNWSGFVSKTDYAEYKIVVPFARDERALHSSIGAILPNAKIRYVTQGEFDHASVLINAEATVKQAFPMPNSVMGLHGYTAQMLTWELSHKSGVLGEEVAPSLDEVVAYFEISSEAEQRNSSLYGAGIFTGLGVSLLFSGIYEALKVLEESRKRSAPN
jgi:hypothetical protein